LNDANFMDVMNMPLWDKTVQGSVLEFFSLKIRHINKKSGK